MLIIQYSNYEDLLNQVARVSSTLATYMEITEERASNIAYLIRQAAENNARIRIVIFPEKHQIHINKDYIKCML